MSFFRSTINLADQSCSFTVLSKWLSWSEKQTDYLLLVKLNQWNWFVVVKKGSIRGELFNTSFLLLCHIGQVYGSKVSLSLVTSPFFKKLILYYLTSVRWRQSEYCWIFPEMTGPFQQHLPSMRWINVLVQLFWWLLELKLKL